MPVTAPTVEIPLGAAAIYEKEITRLQGELSATTTEIQKQEARKAALTLELASLDQQIEAARTSVVSLGEDGKKKTAALAASHAASQKAIDEREAASQKVIDAAAAKTQELSVLSNKVNSARNFLVGLAEDIQACIDKAKADIEDTALRVSKEVQDFYALRDPKANVPEKK